MVLVLGPQSMEFPLTHWNGSVFSMLPRGENATGIGAVTFVGTDSGQASTVLVESLDGNGLGTFKR